MLVSAIVKASKYSKHTIEMIVCFDYCILCGKVRIKDRSIRVNTSDGTYYIHYVSCFCNYYDYNYNDLDEEWMIIRMLNDLGITCDVDINP